MSGNGERFDAVVIGSGFGGSISALRLAEAGRSVLVLERGRRYSRETFPRDVTDVERLFWDYPRRRGFRGLYDVRFLSGIGTVVASGVGGGSLIYANIHIRPDAAVFDDPRWPRSVNRAALEPYYDRVAAMLGIAPVPEEIRLAKRGAFREAARQAGRPIFDPDQAVAWTEPPGEGRQACQLLTQCEFGCPVGAKNTLDFTYLARAEGLGTQVRPGHHVTGVEPASGGGYRVRFRDVQTGEPGAAIGRQVVLAAGTLGTNQILLESRDRARTLPNLSRRLGQGYSGNGDFLGSIQKSRSDLDPWTGPDVTSVIRYDEHRPPFTMAAPTFNREVMEVLAALGQPRPRWWLSPLAPLLWRCLDRLIPWAFRSGLLSRPRGRPAEGAGPPGRMTNLFAIGRDNANGVVRLRGRGIDIRWDFAGENRQLVSGMTDAMREVAEAYGGTFAPLASWDLFRKIITVHSLGGCALSDTPDRGVVSPEGEVHGYPGLFVADGSVIPTAIGFHPAMTIAAVSERIAEAAAAR